MTRTIDVVASALLRCDHCAHFLVPYAVDGHSRPGAQVDLVRGGTVILCAECVTAMAAAIAERVRAEQDARR